MKYIRGLQLIFLSALFEFPSNLRWTDSPSTMLPTIQQLIASGISVWIYRYISPDPNS